MGLDTFDLGESWVGLHKEAGGKWRFVDGQRAIKYGFAKNEELEECASVSLKNSIISFKHRFLHSIEGCKHFLQLLEIIERSRIPAKKTFLFANYCKSIPT